MAEHSPTPWQVITDEWKQTFVADANGQCVLELEWTPSELELADWKHIVRCVNLHNQLVAVCEALIREAYPHRPYGPTPAFVDLELSAKSILAKAKGET